MRCCGVEIEESDLNWLRGLCALHAPPSRSQLARELCERVGLVDQRGRLREVTARKALARLGERGVLKLPAPRRTIPAPSPVAVEQLRAELYRGEATLLEHLGLVEVEPVFARQKTESSQWRALVDSSHYLGDRPLCGAQMRYLVRCPQGLLGALAFSASAWRLAVRDDWIGWSDSVRQERLQLVIANSRFALVPRIPNLASQVLARCVDRLAADWQDHYGYRPLLVETFVDPTRFHGTCYKAAGWTQIGSTTGRGRQDREHAAERRPKDVYVYCLDADAREKLSLEPVRQLHSEGDWARTEFGRCSFADKRLEKRLLTIANDFFARPQASIPQACCAREKTKAAYRFVGHKGVSMDEILESHYEATLSRVAKESVVLVVQDTTTLNYTTHKAIKELGLIGALAASAEVLSSDEQDGGSVDGEKKEDEKAVGKKKKKKKNPVRGLFVHDTLCFSTTGTPLGLLDVQSWSRNGEKTEDRRKQSTRDKESGRWLESYDATLQAQRRLEKTRLVSVADREADMLDLYALARENGENPDLLIRARHDRSIKLPDGKREKLWDLLRSQPCAGTLALQVPRSRKRSKRETTLEIRFMPLSLQHPKGPKKPRLNLWAVLASEAQAPEDDEPVEWLLLTTIAVKTCEQACEKVDWYTKRWQIEVYHRTLKSGCRIEDRQLRTVNRLENCLAIDMVVAWRIFHLAKLGREVPDLPCTVFFDDEQWRALYCFRKKTAPPATPPTLREAIRMVATLGGFLGRKCDGEPGTQTLWRGLVRLDDITETFRVIRAVMAQDEPSSADAPDTS